jgi:predicted pyridoxine 5'-phosphate oxidase superfamily flavin-nucleotide-binding protein
MSTNDGFHAGEQALQRRVGSHGKLQALAPQILRDHMPDQHRELFGKLPTLLLGALDAFGRPQATMLAGPAGFVATPDARHMQIRPLMQSNDPVLASLKAGAPVGVLGLEPHTRRRNRMNGIVAAWKPDGALCIEVRQSFGNCPRYIVPRAPQMLHGASPPAAARTLGPPLDGAAKALIRRSDTLFIASASADPQAGDRSEGVDVSHRGGAPGFIGIDEEVSGALVLTLPDYAGNQFFMTLGNLSVNPAAGLLFVDYAAGGLLHLDADAEIVTHGAALAAWPGAQRLVRLRVRGGLWRPGALPLRWSGV